MLDAAFDKGWLKAQESYNDKPLCMENIIYVSMMFVCKKDKNHNGRHFAKIIIDNTDLSLKYTSIFKYKAELTWGIHQ